MKTSLARLFATFIIGATLMCVKAATPASVNVININRTDGEIERLLIDANLDVTMSEQGTLLLVHPEITIEYQLSEVETITLDSDDEFVGPYDGTHQAGIDAPEITDNETVISLSPEEIRVSGGSDIILYDLKGVKIATSKAENGVATLSTTSLPKGIYIVKSGKSTLKVRI